MKSKQLSRFLAACMALVMIPLLVGSAPSVAEDKLPAWRAKQAGVVQGAAIRRIGDLTEVAVWVTGENSAGVATRRALSAQDISKWTIVAGDGKIFEDSSTGRIFFKPIGAETLVVRPTVGSDLGAEVVVGIDLVSANLPTHEDSVLDAAGGGSCVRSPDGASPSMLDDDAVDVRSVVSISVIPISRTERVVRYQHGEYYAYHPNVGTMRIRYNPDRTSEVRLTSLSPTGVPFFPARAEGGFYFIIETLNNGYKIANWSPMEVDSNVLSWPPFQSPILSTEGAGFFSLVHPDIEMHRIGYQEFYMYPSQGLAVEVDSFEVGDGGLVGSFTLRNRSRISGPIRWFLIGDLNQPLTPTSGQVQLAAGGSVTIAYRAKVTPSAVPQFITVAAVSETGERLVGFKRIDFTSSTGRGKQLALKELTLERPQSGGETINVKAP